MYLYAHPRRKTRSVGQRCMRVCKIVLDVIRKKAKCRYKYAFLFNPLIVYTPSAKKPEHFIPHVGIRL